MKNVGKLFLFLVLCLSVLAGCSGEKNGSNESEMKTLSLAHGGALDSHLHEAALKFQELVEEKSDGSIKVQIHPNSELGAEREMAESLQAGSIDMAVLSTGPLGNFADKVNALDFPFLFESNEHAEKVLDGEVGDQISKQLEDANIKNLYWVDNGAYNIATNDKPIKKFEDLKGLKLRTQENQVQIDTINAFNASATPIAFSELFLSAQQGIVDGQGNSLAVLIPQKYYEVHKYLTITNHMYSGGAILMNNDLFNKFDEDMKEIILSSAKEAGIHEREFVQKLNKEYMEVAKENGMEIIEDIDLEPFKEAVKPVYKKYEDKYGELHKIIESEK
ncbi:TRAP transporter substrate-binding protein [Sporosarcina obsidiansis]|uniref:TRAP transporter substrate-binding protein n=1 Tax=Sporosarcina obsidiansis TaxID=2660748 RepID=UPI00129AD3EB|nr:TRAP transporter substrate-binding protein [Sporosarcina obsidiansis]